MSLFSDSFLYDRRLNYVNQRVKVYPNGTKQITTFSYPAFNPGILNSDPLNNPVVVRPEVLKPVVSSDRKRFDNINRSIQAVFDIALLNDFDYFVTLTFDPKKVNSSDYDLVHDVFLKWLKYYRKKYKSDFRYLFVAELHKSGRVHFHGLVSSVFDMVDSGCVIVPCFDRPVHLHKLSCDVCGLVCDQRVVYNMPEWRYGFSSAVRFQKVDDGYNGTTAIAKYLVKYITKDDKKILKHYYYAGGKLDRVVPTYYNMVDYDQADGLARFVPGAGGMVKYAQVGL